MQTVDEIFTRSFTREEAYNNLIASVKTSEDKRSDLKLKIQGATTIFQGLKVQEREERVQAEENEEIPE